VPQIQVKLYFNVSLLHTLHVFPIVLIINQAELHAINPQPNPDPF